MKKVIWCLFAWAAVVASAAGVREEAIALDFPEQLGEFKLTGRTQFPSKGEGATIVYEGGGVRGAFYVYNAGIASIPTGVGDPVIHRHFSETSAALKQAASQTPGAKVTQVRSQTISAFKGCGPQFLWRADEISMGGNAMVSRTYLAGYRNNFVKLRVTHQRANSATADDFVERARRLLGACA